jgi:hypothetical protein
MNLRIKFADPEGLHAVQVNTEGPAPRTEMGDPVEPRATVARAGR